MSGNNHKPKPRLTEDQIVKIRELLDEQSRRTRATPLAQKMRQRLASQMAAEKDSSTEKLRRAYPRAPQTGQAEIP